MGCLFCLGDGFDLAQDALGKRAHRNAGARGLAGEVACVDLIEHAEVAHVGEEAGGLDDLLRAASCGLQNGHDVLAGLLRLGLDPLGDAAVGGVDADLAGRKDKTVGDEALGVGADGAGGLVGADNSHGNYLRIKDLIHLL